MFFVIAAGSMLEIMLDRHDISFPVGRVDFFYLYESRILILSSVAGCVEI